MTVRDYLAQYRNLEFTIRLLREEINRKRGDLELPRGIRYDGIRVMNTPKDYFAEAVAELAAEEERLQGMIVECERLRKKILMQIAILPNPKHILVLQKRILEGKTLEQAADEMAYSIQHTKRLYLEAVREFDKEYGPF